MNLSIYSASAGTGKTHTLTGEYLSLLFRGNERHRYILAVTFTNKATAEMKNRIIRELFRLADNQTSDFLEILSQNGQKNETTIRVQAKSILRTILHDYSSFHVNTIDHFFQQTLRAFTREVGLQGNYQVELEKNGMLEESVENMFAELEKSDNKTLMNWLLQFSEHNIEEGGGWDIRHHIIKLGEQLFKETYKSHHIDVHTEIQQKQLLAGYHNILLQIIRDAREKAKELGEQGLKLMNKHGLQPADFKGASRSPFHFFRKIVEGGMEQPTNTFLNLADNVDEYVSKKASSPIKQAAERIFEDGMNELIQRVISFFNQLTDYYTACEISRNLYALGILSDLSRHIAQWREDNNKMLIDDTNELLNKIIDGSEIPFIYEKTGVRIDNYMIDEFQDTSKMQWSNFYPLLKDSLDNGRHSLIVGDVKQSIYRFRNSDWKLLDSQVKKEFDKQANEINLNVNWRSFRQIVELNNQLFEVIPGLLQQAYNTEVEQAALSAEEKERYQTCITSVYQNTTQQVAPPLKQQDGFVSIQFLSDTDEQKWKEQSMNQLPQILEQLQENGYALRDIAILTRTNTEGLLVAENLLNYKETHPESPYKYDIISEDSLTVGTSLTVRWMIAMLRSLHQPDNANYAEMAQVAYAILKREKHISSDVPEGVLPINRFFQLFNPDIIAELRQLSNRSLYELVEGLFRLFETDFPENEIIYIQALFDAITEFSMSETPDLGRFLTWWDEKGHTKKIITPESQNAIRIMTIHKSKGLGFKVVIIPFADWKIDQKDAILWCSPTRQPFNTLSLVPVRYGKALQKTIFAPDYFEEKLYAYIDNLNALYVAFTRAKETLVVMAPQPKAETVSIAGLLWNGLLTDELYPLDTENGLYERGALYSKVSTAQTESSAHIPEEPQEWPVERFHSRSSDNRLALRLRSKDGFFDDEKRKYGLLMHELLSHIEKRDDIAYAINEKHLSGELNSEEAVVLREKLLALTAGDEVCPWFDGSMQVMNEAEILCREGKSFRPDRIMIDRNSRVVVVDYKSGEQKEKSHRRQIERYVALIRAMGYQNVSGYIWYISLQEIEKIFF